MSRELQGIVLLLVGIITLRISWGTTFLNYVKEEMRPWLLLSGAVLVLLGVLAIVDALRGRGDDDADHGVTDHDDGHGHGHGGPRSAWLLLLPVVTLFVIAPPALGAYAAARDTSNSAPTTTALPPLPPGDPVPVYLSDYVTRAVWEQGVSLEGRTVELTGFVLPTDDGWQLARLQIACCAADAFASKVQPIGVPEEFADLPSDTWLTLTGRWVPTEGEPSVDTIPLVQVDSLVTIPQPDNPYD
jgi:uncharacterized repeat protein (TIGR03943 family)